MTICIECKKEMDEESQDFEDDYEIGWCLDCMGKDMIDSAEKGIMYRATIPVYKN